MFATTKLHTLQRRYGRPKCALGYRTTVIALAVRAAKRPKNNAGSKQSTLVVSVEPDGSDSWRLDGIIDMIKDGAVGIIPTDSLPALVCDLENRAAVQQLYELKGASPSKKLSILCRNFSDVSTYTLGFPVASAPGQTNFYKTAKQILPGPYTLILQASKALPKQITNYESGKSKHRSTVGVRLPDDTVCQTILQQLDRPLLCSTATGPTEAEGGAPEEDDVEGMMAPEFAVLADYYGPRGLAFVVDVGPKVKEPSTVIDLSGAEPVLVRQGKGETSWLE